MFAVNLTDFSPKNWSTVYLSATGSPTLGLKISNKLLKVWIFLDHKNDTNTPEIWELWVLEVGPVLRHKGNEPASFYDFKFFIYN